MKASPLRCSFFGGLACLLLQTSSLVVTNAAPINGQEGADFLAELEAPTSPAAISAAQAAAGIRDGDHFDDNSKDPLKWNPDIQWKPGGNFQETRGRLEFRGNESVLRPWICNYGSYTAAWEVSVDVTLGSLALPTGESHVELLLWVSNGEDDSYNNKVAGDHFAVALDLYRNSSGGMARRLAAYLRRNGSDIGQEGQAFTSAQKVTLKIAFTPATKTLSAWYNASGSAENPRWVHLRSARIDGAGANWGMRNTCRFQFALGATCDNFTVTSSHQAYFDNFRVNLSLDPPYIVGHPQSRTILLGSTATFTVNAMGDPPLRYQWYKDDAALAGKTGATLTLAGVQTTAAGAYKVVVSNGAGSVSSATAVLRVEAARPVVKITAPSQGARVTVNEYTLKGTASDDVGVAEVWYDLNGTGWRCANGTINWSAREHLRIGYNYLRAYAVDMFGKHSPIKSVDFTNRVMQPLSLAIVGRGTVSGATNGQMLEIGRIYTLTNKPAAGFALLNWASNLSEPIGGRTFRFVMHTNLLVTATFIDTTRPVVAITSPRTNQQLNGAEWTVRGKASDNVRVSQVQVRLNNGEWQSTAGTTNWQVAMNFPPGTNTLRVYAVDAQGNRSLTDRVSFTVKVGMAGQLVQRAEELEVADEAPRLEMVRGEGNQVNLIVHAQPGSEVEILSCDTLVSPGTWRTHQIVHMQSFRQPLSPFAVTNGTTFFRAQSLNSKK